MLQFRVYGVPRPQGSMKAFMRKGARFPIVTSDNPALRPWRQLVQSGAMRAVASQPAAEHRAMFREGVRLTIAFFLPRPKSLPKTREVAHVTKPDLDKLVRSCCDSLSTVVFRDDSQVCELVTAKHYAAPGKPPYADITIESTPGVQRIVVAPVPLPLFPKESHG